MHVQLNLSGKENPSCFSQRRRKNPTKRTSTHHLQSSEAVGRQAGGCVEIFIIIGFMLIPAQSQEVVKTNLCVHCCISLGINNFPMLCPLKNFFLTLKSSASISPCNKLLPAAKSPRAEFSVLLIVSFCCRSLCFAFLISFFSCSVYFPPLMAPHDFVFSYIISKQIHEWRSNRNQCVPTKPVSSP